MNLRSIGTRTITVVGALGAVVGLTAGVAGAQTGPPGGPFASGMVTSISGSALQLQRTNPDSQGQTDVSVTLNDSTTYQKVQQATADAINAGACVRVAGKGSVQKGKITASMIAVTAPSSTGCTRPGGANGATPGAGPGGIGGLNGGTTANGSNPPSSSFPRNGNGRRRAGGIAFGSVQSVKGNVVTVKAAEFSGRRPSSGSQPPTIKTKNVKVTLSSSTTVTQLVGASQSDLATGQCVNAAGTGDAEAITAQRVTISQPVNGACMGFGGGGGGGALAT
jgi:hypothetical protein